MAKLEELSELLVSEIRDFEVAVKKLEEIQKNKIQLDIENLKTLLAEHKQVLHQKIAQNNITFQSTENLFKQTKSYYKKIILLVIIGLLLNLASCTSILYFKL